MNIPQKCGLNGVLRVFCKLLIIFSNILISKDRKVHSSNKDAVLFHIIDEGILAIESPKEVVEEGALCRAKAFDLVRVVALPGEFFQMMWAPLSGVFPQGK